MGQIIGKAGHTMYRAKNIKAILGYFERLEIAMALSVGFMGLCS